MVGIIAAVKAWARTSTCDRVVLSRNDPSLMITPGEGGQEGRRTGVSHAIGP